MPDTFCSCLGVFFYKHCNVVKEYDVYPEAAVREHWIPHELLSETIGYSMALLAESIKYTLELLLESLGYTLGQLAESIKHIL